MDMVVKHNICRQNKKNTTSQYFEEERTRQLEKEVIEERFIDGYINDWLLDK